MNYNTMNKTIKLTETDLHNIIKESVKHILINEDYIKYHKHNNPYNDKESGNGITQPLKNNTSLYDIRARIPNILYALKNNREDDAKKQLLRLYKLVDAMINQGF